MRKTSEGERIFSGKKAMKTDRFSDQALIFQYGSNMSSKRLNEKNRLNGEARFVGIAYTKDDYELEFTVWSKKNKCAVANIRLCDSGRKIWGVLYEIPWHRVKRDLSGLCRTLDSIEGEGKTYRRTVISLRSQNGHLIDQELQTYLGLRPEKGKTTSLEYVSYIIKGLREHNMPNDYVNYVKTQAIGNNPELKNDICIL